jgi:hypothetical protein
MAWTSNIDLIQKLYIAFYGRPADPGGLRYWASQLPDNATPNSAATRELISRFINSQEAQERFGSPSLNSTIVRVYTYAFRRDATDADKAKYAGKTVVDVLVDVLSVSYGPDYGTLNEKLQYAKWFTNYLDPNGDGIPNDDSTGTKFAATFYGNTDAETAKSKLHDIWLGNPAVQSKVLDDVRLIADTGDYIITNPPVTGQTFTLTTGADNITGTSGNDTINGYVNVNNSSLSTLTGADQINGGPGTDTLNVTFENATINHDFPGATISGVEVFNLRNISGKDLTINANNVPGATQIWADRATANVIIQNLAPGATAGMKGNGVVTNGALTFSYDSGATEAKLAIDGGTKAGNIVHNTIAGLTKVSITSTGAANTVGNIDLKGSGTASVTELNINATTNLTTGNITGFAGTSAKINVTGTASKVNIGTLENTTVKTLDASGFAGGVTAVLNTNTGIVVKGGQGNDTFTTGATITGTASVDAGAGTADRLIVAASAHITAAAGALYKGFEQLQVNDNVSVDLDHLATNNNINAVIINQGTNPTGVTNMTATQAANVTVMGTGDGVITFGVKNASNAGQIDTLKITVDDGTATKQSVTLTAPVMTGVEKLELTAVENVTVTALTSATALNDVKVTGAGNVTVTTGAVDFAANTVFDFTGVTGTVTFNASAAQAGATSTGLLIKGSSMKANTIHDSQKADIVQGGSGNDIFIFTGGADTITMGGGADTFNFNGVVGSNGMGTGLTFIFASTDSVADKDAGTGLAKGISATKTDTITGFDVTAFTASTGAKFTIDTDKSATTVNVVTSPVNFGVTTVSAAYGFLVVNDTANNAAYVFQDTNGNSIIDDGEFAIKLVGLAPLDASEFSVVGGNLVFTSA